MALQTFCTPYLSRTIKGWKITVKICFTVDSAAYVVASYATQAASIATALGTLTNSTWMVGGGFQHNIEQSWATSTNDYDNAEDKVVLNFATGEGTIGRIGIPNPVDTIFLADKMTVDPANTHIVAFLALLNLGADPTANLVAGSGSGAMYATFLGGLRKRSRTRRKMNIWVRNPELSAPGI